MKKTNPAPKKECSNIASSLIAKARLYWHGRGVRKNARRALALYEEAAGMGDPQHQLEFGERLWDLGRPQTTKKAIKWLKRAAKQGVVGAQYFLGREYATGESIRKNAVEGMRWYRMAAHGGDAEAQYNLGIMYWEGDGVKKSLSTARKWVLQSAKNNYEIAQELLGKAYKDGLVGFSIDLSKSRRWFRRYKKAIRSSQSRGAKLAASKKSGDKIRN